MVKNKTKLKTFSHPSLLSRLNSTTKSSVSSYQIEEAVGKGGLQSVPNGSDLLLLCSRVGSHPQEIVLHKLLQCRSF